MKKSSTTVGPLTYEQWRSIKYVRKEKVLEQMVGKRLDIVPRKHDYLFQNEVEQSICFIANLDRQIADQIGG